MVAPLLEDEWDARITVDNQPGAAGRIAANQLARAKPDGRTVGTLDASGLLLWGAYGDRSTPALERDFTLLARITRSDTVLATSARSGIRSLEQLRSASTTRRIVFGNAAQGSQNFLSCAAVARLLDLDAAFVVGYPGSKEIILGLLRGDCDAVCLSTDSVLDEVGSGDIVPLATFLPSSERDAAFDTLPSLGDPATVLALRPDLGRNTAPVLAVADAIVRSISVGRVLATPAGLPDALRDCMVGGLRQVLTSAELRRAGVRARRAFSPAFGDEISRDLAAAKEALPTLLSLAAEAAPHVR